MSTAQYYCDFDRYVASVDEGHNGFFVRRGTDPDTEWEFVIPGSLRWDSLHQDIYYAHHDLEPCPKEIVDTLPPLPQVPSFKALRWEDNFLPLKKMPVSDFPFLANKIKETNGELQFWFVLDEDLYETYYGDGTFLYFHGEVYLSETEAMTRLKAEEEESKTREHPYDEISIAVKKARAVIENEEIVPYDFLPHTFEDYRIEAVVARVEKVMSSQSDE